MILSDMKYVDPSPVLNSIADDTGNFIPIGDQKDVGEFNLFFLARIEEGLQQQESLKKKTLSRIEEENELRVSGIAASPERNLGSSHSEMIRTISMNIIGEESIVSQLFFMRYKQIISFYGEEKQYVIIGKFFYI